MADIIDLTLLADSRRYLQKLLDTRGITYFLKKEGHRLFQIEPAKVELVIRTVMRSRKSGQSRPPEQAVEHCRAEIRRELIRRVASAMLQTGL